MQKEGRRHGRGYETKRRASKWKKRRKGGKRRSSGWAEESEERKKGRSGQVSRGKCEESVSVVREWREGGAGRKEPCEETKD